MKRREFLLALLAGATAAALTGWRGTYARLSPRRWLRARPTDTYPGRIAALREDRVRQISFWNG
jgi:hypothetical protein